MSKKGILCALISLILVVSLSTTVFAEQIITTKLKSYITYEYPLSYIL